MNEFLFVGGILSISGFLLIAIATYVKGSNLLNKIGTILLFLGLVSVMRYVFDLFGVSISLISAAIVAVLATLITYVIALVVDGAEEMVEGLKGIARFLYENGKVLAISLVTAALVGGFLFWALSPR